MMPRKAYRTAQASGQNQPVYSSSEQSPSSSAAGPSGQGPTSQRKPMSSVKDSPEPGDQPDPQGYSSLAYGLSSQYLSMNDRKLQEDLFRKLKAEGLKQQEARCESRRGMVRVHDSAVNTTHLAQRQKNEHAEKAKQAAENKIRGGQITLDWIQERRKNAEFDASSLLMWRFMMCMRSTSLLRMAVPTITVSSPKTTSESPMTRAVTSPIESQHPEIHGFFFAPKYHDPFVVENEKEVEEDSELWERGYEELVMSPEVPDDQEDMPTLEQRQLKLDD
ncbi:hypothetical protein FPANT_4003 [Fusarium pseudoanthophilum]|uniref:Uncharacterized protein n=1 Tax=Fusarium pseudoanthophilum TaxID=48495 RepID=A0A8H5UUF4_9HYPO|nr:hypothetical protein FPANT_4003 [Fusarium pseudoanthophilum]